MPGAPYYAPAWKPQSPHRATENLSVDVFFFWKKPFDTRSAWWGKIEKTWCSDGDGSKPRYYHILGEFFTSIHSFFIGWVGKITGNHGFWPSNIGFSCWWSIRKANGVITMADSPKMGWDHPMTGMSISMRPWTCKNIVGPSDLWKVGV